MKATHSRSALPLLLLCLGTGCGLFASGPSGTVRTLISDVEQGRIEQASRLFSSRVAGAQGIHALRSELSSATSVMKQRGGIRSVKISGEQTVGEVAEVTVAIEYRDGNVPQLLYELIREDGQWKIDHIEAAGSADATNSGPAADGNIGPPRQPAAAVGAALEWAHRQGVAHLAEWLRQQPSPPVCTAAAATLNTLADEIRYHLVEDAETSGRVLQAINPVLRLVGCQNAQGLVLYKGQSISAVNLQSGHIAVAPEGLYSAEYIPDERVFHTRAKLRLFLARAIFKQLVPVEQPAAGLSTGDMQQRRELKVNYLAAIASLAIDNDPKALDAMALDVSLYGEPINTGQIRDRAGLPQIKDVFGAAQQDWRDRQQR